MNQAGAIVNANVTDGGSGPASSPVSAAAETSIIGSKSVSLTGYNNVGHSTTESCSYSVIYDFTGFFRPIDNLPVLNVVKAGSAIPVKFSLSGYQGMDIFATGYPKSQTVLCDSNALVDGVEELATAGSSGLSYDASIDQYVYVWKTDKAWAGTCRQLVVLLNDGTFHRANFKFNK